MQLAFTVSGSISRDLKRYQVPIYNKLVFAQGVYTRAGSLHKYPYPIATAFLQLGVVSLVLAVVNTVGHFCCDRRLSCALMRS